MKNKMHDFFSKQIKNAYFVKKEDEPYANLA